MRTTIRLDDQLLADIKRLALGTGRTLAAVIEDSLRETLARRSRSTQRTPLTLITTGGNGLLPGVDLDDSAALQDIMDQRDVVDRR